MYPKSESSGGYGDGVGIAAPARSAVVCIGFKDRMLAIRSCLFNTRDGPRRACWSNARGRPKTEGKTQRAKRSLATRGPKTADDFIVETTD